MAGLIFLIGLLQIIGGLLVLLQANSAIHEILAALAFGFGVLSLALSVVISRLTEIRDKLDKGQA